MATCWPSWISVRPYPATCWWCRVGTRPILYALAPDEAAAAMRMAQRVAQVLREEFNPPGLNLWQSNGRVAGQEVFHFHLHVQPRRVGDGLLRVYPDGVPRPAATDVLDALAHALRTRLHG